MRARLLIVSAVVLVACGESTPAPPASPSNAALPASPSSGSPTVPSAGECHGLLTKARPTGWVEVGTLVVTTKDEMPTGYELRDLSGKKVDGGEISAKTARAAAELVGEKICRVQGVLAVFEGKAGANGQMIMSVVRPLREDEPADLAALCKEPTGMASLDEAQKRRVAVDQYGQTLTSAKWRDWLFAMSAKLRKSDDAGRAAIMSSHADALETAAKGAGNAPGTCWFATTLKKSDR